jgi:hypothetical protein
MATPSSPAIATPTTSWFDTFLQFSPAIFGALDGVTAFIGGTQAQNFSNDQAAALERAGELNAAAAAFERRKLAGAQRVAAAVSGVDPGSGSAMDVIMESYLMGLLEQASIRFNFDSRADSIRAEGRILAQRGLAQGIQAGVAGILGSFERGLFASGDPDPDPAGSTRSPVPTTFGIPTTNPGSSTSFRSGDTLIFGGPGGTLTI